MAQSTYTQSYSNFIGVDLSSDPRTVSRNRLAYCVNMWRDYESEQGAAIETFPGFRSIHSTRESDKDVYSISGLWHYKGAKNEYIIYQEYNGIYALKLSDLTSNPIELYVGANPDGVTSFTINNRLYLVSGESGTGYKPHLVVISQDGNEDIKAEEIEEYYVPTTYYNGLPYEQRNALTNTVKQIDTGGGIEDSVKQDSNGESIKVRKYVLYEKGTDPIEVYVNGVKYEYAASNQLTQDKYATVTSGGYIKYIILREADVKDGDTESFHEVKLVYNASTVHFNKVGNLTHFQNDKLTMAEAILGCTKSAVYDGRVFLTGNSDLPNTVFYSQRNLTGANDPTYFGVYNYFNDGDGNTPNVDMLATPSMLMVIKNNTVQDGSVYYHVGTSNTHSDKSVRDLMPRLYPSTQGAAGLGSAGDTRPYSLSCNFLDDLTFISQRGLEAVSKEQLNSERTIGHRSSNVDKLLIKENLKRASIAEWKGYLVICCNGHIYLADSRSIKQHPDGSYQYEWFYLEGVGTYREYQTKYKYLTQWPDIPVPIGVDENLDANEFKYVSLKDFEINDNEKVSDFAVTYNSDDYVYPQKDVVTVYSREATCFEGAIFPKSVTFAYAQHYDGVNTVNYLVEDTGEKTGKDEDFCGAKFVLAVGDLLFFATDFDICVFNTDKRGEDGRIPSEWYNFNNVAYLSGCSLKLDDCDKKTLTKNTVYGTTAARFKMMPGSRCKIKSTVNGRDWETVGEAYSSRTDFSDFQFDNMSFGEDEDNALILPELSRGWINKQYYFYSDGYCEPFGLYELSYMYRIAGKIRYY